MSSQSFTLGSPAATGYETTNYLQLVTSGQTATSHYGLVAQNIEDVRTLAGETVTVSFYAKATSGTPKIGTELLQTFGTGGGASSMVSTPLGAATLSTSWARYSFTTTLPSLSGKTLGATANTHYLALALWCSAGTDSNTRASSIGIQSNTFHIWGVQVERGSYATPYELRNIQQETTLCERFYQYYDQPHMTGVTAFTNNAVAYRVGTVLRTAMRAAPNVSFSGTVNVFDGGNTPSVSSIGTQYNTIHSVEFDLNLSSALQAITAAVIYANTSGKMFVNAEF